MLRRVLVLAGVVGLLGVVGARQAVADQPSINVTPGVTTPGTQVTVTGSGFTKGELVRLSLCGNGAALGSVDCDQQTSEIFPPTETGAFQIRLPITKPPKPCPCVVVARASNLDHDITVPITLLGVASGPIELPAPTGVPVKVVGASLSGWGPLAAWFGGAPHRTLTVRIKNTSSAPVAVPPVALTRGRSANPTTVARTAELGQIQPGETKAWQIPVTFDALSVGRYTVSGSIDGFGDPIKFSAKTSAFPWGLLLVGLLVVQLLLVKVRNRARRRLAAGDIDPAVEEPSATPELAPKREAEPERVPEPASFRALPAAGNAQSRRTPPVRRRQRPLRYEKPNASKARPAAPKRRSVRAKQAIPARPVASNAPAILELRELATAFSGLTQPNVIDLTASEAVTNGHQAITDELMHAGYESMDEFPTVDALNYWGSALLTTKSSSGPHLSAVPKAG